MLILTSISRPNFDFLQQEVDNESTEDIQKQNAEVDLSQLKELPLLDIVDSAPTDPAKPMSGAMLPSEATMGSSNQDLLESPFGELISEDDPIKLLKQREQTKSQGELMDDGSNLEKAKTYISEREASQATQNESASNIDQQDGGDYQSYSTVSKQATDIGSKQATELSFGGAQRSTVRKVDLHHSLVYWTITVGVST